MDVRSYVIVTFGYWAFTVTDGALRMLVLLYFHDQGYNALALALLFVLYEFFGVVTNLVGGWLGARRGLRITLVAGLTLQVTALALLAVLRPSWPTWLAVGWVMGAQALSGIAKDLTKMSAKTAVKFVAGKGRLFQLVAMLTGSKNALKGAGFFVGAVLLSWLGFRGALLVMAAAIAIALVVVTVTLPDLGRVETKPAASSIMRKSPAIQRLSLARFFLFGSRDIWFVIALPVFLDDSLGWSFEATGAFLAVWVIGYGGVQSLAPRMLRGLTSLRVGAFALLPPMGGITAVIAAATIVDELKALATVAGLLVFGVLFAITSSVHSYLILAYSATPDDTAMDVGFYYSANAAGRLVGTVLSGVLYLLGGFAAALIGAAIFLQVAFAISWALPDVPSDRSTRPAKEPHVALP